MLLYRQYAQSVKEKTAITDVIPIYRRSVATGYCCIDLDPNGSRVPKREGRPRSRDEGVLPFQIEDTAFGCPGMVPTLDYHCDLLTDRNAVSMLDQYG